VHPGSIQIASTGINWQEIAIVIAGPAILAGLALFLKRAKIGLAIRSVAHNQDAALLVGIDVDRTYGITFGLGAMLAAVAGLLYGGEYYVLPTMGEDPLLRAFVVVVLGGLGSLGGTFVAAYAVGAVETVSQYFVGPFWSPVVLFAVLVLALLFRPAGLFGRSEQ
jgi:branched-chain amino acid transport system permease protein